MRIENRLDQRPETPEPPPSKIVHLGEPRGTTVHLGSPRWTGFVFRSIWSLRRRKIVSRVQCGHLLELDTKNGQFEIFGSASFSVIILWLMSHKLMTHIFLIWINFNANKKIWVIIHMSHESWKMSENGAEAKFSNWPFLVFSANKWPWWPLKSTVIWSCKLVLQNVMISRGHHAHLLALETKNGQFENLASTPFSVIFYDSWVISITTHIFFISFKFILFRNICIMSLWLMSRKIIIENVTETKFQNGPFLTTSANKWPHWTQETFSF